jgi:hypothetical protein
MKYGYEPLTFQSGYRSLQLLAPAHPRAAVQTPSAAFQERGLKEADSYFLANPPCRHLREKEAAGSGIRKWGNTIYRTRPATCRDFCGKTMSGGKRHLVPEWCTMAGGGVSPYELKWGSPLRLYLPPPTGPPLKGSPFYPPLL